MKREGYASDILAQKNIYSLGHTQDVDWIKLRKRLEDGIYNAGNESSPKMTQDEKHASTHLVVWGTDNTCFVPMNSPHCRSNPPDWSEREAACCCTEARGARETLSVQMAEQQLSGSKLTACLGVVSWKQRPLGLSLEGSRRGPILYGGFTSDWSMGWMTTEVSGVWWTRTLNCTEDRQQRKKKTSEETKNITNAFFF